jgi:hypothetical protein
MPFESFNPKKIENCINNEFGFQQTQKDGGGIIFSKNG